MTVAQLYFLLCTKIQSNQILEVVVQSSIETKKKVVIFFSGTGNDEESFLRGYDYINAEEEKNVITLCVKGCDAPEVCNSELFPDLEKFSERFTETLFNENRELNLDIKTLKSVGVSTIRYNGENIPLDKEIPYDLPKTIRIGTNECKAPILLSGYSRGGVTCPHVARKLDKKLPNMKVDMVMDNPVPGTLYEPIGSNSSKISDCSDLKNLNKVSIIVGSYTGKIMHYGTKIEEEIRVWDETKDKEDDSLFHRLFFSQVIPRFPSNTERDLIVVPIESHHNKRINAPSPGGREEEHLNLQIAKYLKEDGLVSKRNVEMKENKVRNLYREHQDKGVTFFPPSSQLQRFYGSDTGFLYHHLDKLHPTPYLRKGMTMEKNESLINWWNKHDKKASIFSSELTKDLVKHIEEVNQENGEELLSLFNKADCWLIRKDNAITTRFEQVENLRNNVYHLLVTKFGMSEEKLALQSRANKHNLHYFLNHWHEASNALSSVKSKETKTLDQKFSEHDRAQLSKENDEILLDELSNWLKAKQGSSSKRYDLVVNMYEHLKKVIDNSYKEEINTAMNTITNKL